MKKFVCVGAVFFEVFAHPLEIGTKPNVSKTVNALASKGFVRLKKIKGYIIKPVALFTEFELIVNSPVEARIQKILSFKATKVA